MTSTSGTPSVTATGRPCTFCPADGTVRDHHYGEGGYADCERTLQRLLRIRQPLLSPNVRGRGVEAPADWGQLRSPETYLGYARSDSLASSVGGRFDTSAGHKIPDDLSVNQWGLDGEWTVGREYLEPSSREVRRRSGSTPGTCTPCCRAAAAPHSVSGHSWTVRRQAAPTAPTWTPTGAACS